MFDNKDKMNVVKMIDFGWSKNFSKTDDLVSVAGSPVYVAPEICQKLIDKRTLATKYD